MILGVKIFENFFFPIFREKMCGIDETCSGNQFSQVFAKKCEKTSKLWGFENSKFSEKIEKSEIFGDFRRFAANFGEF